jgi:hypothetical protein
MDLILVRHGESEGNAVRRLQGRIDSPLSERGGAPRAVNGTNGVCLSRGARSASPANQWADLFRSSGRSRW